MKRFLCATPCLLALTACPGPSATPDARPAPDATPDAPPPDAAWAVFTGAYEDWDSTDQDFHGVFDAIVADDADPATTVSTAPNGRATLGVPPGAPSQVTFAKDGYLPARDSVDPAVIALGDFELRGITPARVTTFFQTELGGLTYDAGTALVQIELRTDGAAVSFAGAPAGFHGDPVVGWSAGATQAGGAAYVVFPNVAVGTGSIALTITPPSGAVTCTAPASLALHAGEVDMATVVCQ